MSCIRYIRSYIIDFLCMQFSRYIQIRISKTHRASHLLLTDCLSVIRTQNFFWTLITGKPSVNSTALLMGLARRIVVRPYQYLFLTSTAFPSSSFSFKFGGHLLSHTVSSAVPSAVQVLTIVFGMGTGVTPGRIATKRLEFLARSFRA